MAIVLKQRSDCGASNPDTGDFFYDTKSNLLDHFPNGIENIDNQTSILSYMNTDTVGTIIGYIGEVSYSYPTVTIQTPDIYETDIEGQSRQVIFLQIWS